MRLLAAVATFAALVLAPAAMAETAPLQVRTFPGGTLYPYPLDSVRGVQGLLAPNTAMVNGGPAAVTVASVEFELLRGEDVVETRTLGPSDLDRSARGGAGLQASGMMDAVAFVFGDVLGKPAAKLPATATLAPGEGLLVANQVFAWSGQRDALRITARSADGALLGQTRIALNTAPPEPRYIWPLKGASYAAAGPTFSTHHRWAVPEAFAFDIVRITEGSQTHRGDGMAFTDYAVYAAPIRAAADGQVVAVVSGEREDPTQFRRAGETTEAYFERIQAWQAAGLARGSAFLAGNYVVIRHPWGEYSLYAHMKPGTATVKVGQTVTAGDIIGQVGSSGSSTEPHLHFQVCDAPGPLDCIGHPIGFKGVEVPIAMIAGAIQSGDIVEAQ